MIWGENPPFSETHHVLRQATRHVHCQLHYWPSTPHNLLDCPRPLVDSSSDFHLNRPQLCSEANRMHTRQFNMGRKSCQNIHFKICPNYHPDAPCMDSSPTFGQKWPHSRGNGWVNVGGSIFRCQLSVWENRVTFASLLVGKFPGLTIRKTSMDFSGSKREEW